MELRPMRTALLAGRAAARWSSSAPTTALRPSFISSTCIANSYRSFSSTRLALQEAEAAAPQVDSISHYVQQRAQQQQAAPRTQAQTPANRARSNEIFAPVPAQTAAPLYQPWRSSSGWTQPKSNVVTTVDQAVTDVFSGPSQDDVEEKLKRYHEDPMKRKLRLRPVVGRTINLKTIRDVRSQDLASGLTRLSIMCKANSVKQESNRQRFHERPGLKRKRQKSERWVKRFRTGFQATCKRVMELAKQGW